MTFKTLDGRLIIPQRKQLNVQRVMTYLDKLPSGIVIEGNVDLANRVGVSVPWLDHRLSHRELMDYVIEARRTLLWASKKTIRELRKQVDHA